MTEVRKCVCDSTPIYDIEMLGQPNFYLSAGVFVHNSKDVADSIVGSVYNALSDPLHEAFSEDTGLDLFLDANRSLAEISDEIMFGG